MDFRFRLAGAIFLSAVFGLHFAANGSLHSTLPKPLVDDDFLAWSKPGAALGQLLFYDRVLSGNFRIACATCHNHDRATSDGAVLPGQLSAAEIEKKNGRYEKLVPVRSRNSPSLFNLGAREFRTLFHDGRLSINEDMQFGFLSPAGNDLPKGLKNIVAAQAMFPTSTLHEMAMPHQDNEFDAAARKGAKFIWPLLAKRVQELPEYLPYFQASYPEVKTVDDITMVHIANALSDFVINEWRADNSAFDRYLRGEKSALNGQAIDGATLFYGGAGCSDCHSGALQTDHKLKTDGDGEEFRTPSLRNIVHTAPYGRSKILPNLRSVIKTHPIVGESGLKSDEINQLLAFLDTLTDEASLKGRLGKPLQVPSSLEVD